MIRRCSGWELRLALANIVLMALIVKASELLSSLKERTA